MGFGPVRTVFVTVCLGIWMQFAAVQSIAASDVATEFLLKTNSQKPSAILSSYVLHDYLWYVSLTRSLSAPPPN